MNARVRRRAGIVLGLLAVWTGAVWALQGAGILPGSFMSGDRLWLAIGLLTAAAGLGVVAAAWRSRR